jgi:Arc/MetJ-type ribon-helix-helix transcriptional regulator
MKVRLSPEHKTGLSEQVAAGQFASIDAALVWAIEGMMHFADGELEWARPYIEKGDASLARGEGTAGDEFLAGLYHRLEKLR